MLILFTATDRIEYLRRVLASWAVAARHSEEPLTVMAWVEPSSPEVAQAFRDIKWADVVEVHVNEQRLGLPENPYRGLEAAFGWEKWVVWCEDDVKVAPDTAEYFAWCRDRFWDDSQVLAATGVQLQFADAQPREGSSVVRRSKAFRPGLWGTWRDRWESWIGPNWSKYHPSGWDWSMGQYVNDKADVFSAAPIWSRGCHIGRKGQYMVDSLWFGNQPPCFLTEYAGPPYVELLTPPRDPGPTGMMAKDVWVKD